MAVLTIGVARFSRRASRKIQLRDGLDAQLGGITAARTQPGGFTGGLAERLQLADGSRLLAKDIPASHVLAGNTATRPRPAGCCPLPLRRHGCAGTARLATGSWSSSTKSTATPVLAPGSPDVGRAVAVAGGRRHPDPCPVAAAGRALGLVVLRC